MDKLKYFNGLAVIIIIALAATGCFNKSQNTGAGGENSVVMPKEIAKKNNMDNIEKAEFIYKIDVEKSRLEWSSRKVLVRTNDHVGSVKIKSGEIVTEDDKFISGNFIIDMTTINDEDLNGAIKEQLEKHLKSEDFFAVEKYPEAKLVITGVNPAEAKNSYVINGELTIKGITNPINFPAEIIRENESIAARADIEIDRSKWDIRYGSGSFFSDLGNNLIDDVIKFKINITANK